MLRVPVITLDGPSGSGKGTIGGLLAQKLGWHQLDSGAVYRALALVAHKKQLALTELPALVALARTLPLYLRDRDRQLEVFWEQHQVTEEIRSETCAAWASKLAAFPAIRAVLTELFRDFAKAPGLVADGRDMGTVVFPDALLKIFLTATVETRAQRRLLQLQAAGRDANLLEILRGLQERDARDENRVTAPTKPDAAAIIIDTTKLSADDVVQLVLAQLKTLLK